MWCPLRETSSVDSFSNLKLTSSIFKLHTNHATVPRPEPKSRRVWGANKGSFFFIWIYKKKRENNHMLMKAKTPRHCERLLSPPYNFITSFRALLTAANPPARRAAMYTTPSSSSYLKHNELAMTNIVANQPKEFIMHSRNHVLLQGRPAMRRSPELWENLLPYAVLQRLLVDICNTKQILFSPTARIVNCPHILSIINGSTCCPPPIFCMALSQSSFSRLTAFCLSVKSSTARFRLHRRFVSFWARSGSLITWAPTGGGTDQWQSSVVSFLDPSGCNWCIPHDKWAYCE